MTQEQVASPKELSIIVHSQRQSAVTREPVKASAPRLDLSSVQKANIQIPTVGPINLTQRSSVEQLMISRNQVAMSLNNSSCLTERSGFRTAR